MTLTKQLGFYYLKEISYYKVYVGLLYKRNINEKEKNMNCHATNQTVLSFHHMYFQICFNLTILFSLPSEEKPKNIICYETFLSEVNLHVLVENTVNAIHSL